MGKTIDEDVLMTPSKQGQITYIRCEKVPRGSADASKVALVGSGPLKGIVINQQQEEVPTQEAPELSLSFRCYLKSAQTGKRSVENRTMNFWFRGHSEYSDRVAIAFEFFKDLVKPVSFARDYAGFIKNLMVQLREERFDWIVVVTCAFEPLPDILLEGVDFSEEEKEALTEEKVREKVLSTLESAYPSILPVEELMKLTNLEEEQVLASLNSLTSSGLIKELQPRCFTREAKQEEDDEVYEVQNMPLLAPDEQPTIAVVTAAYCEKLAVDAMMEDKRTFVKYKTEGSPGESNVYTIGYIGKHKVVSTKLPAHGRSREEQIAAGSTTTRLLGTFGAVQHVILVGVGGGVAHYTDFSKHPRLGDVVVSSPNKDGAFYVYCDKVKRDDTSGRVLGCSRQMWCPPEHVLLSVAQRMMRKMDIDPAETSWEDYIKQGQQNLKSQKRHDFSRPPSETDRLNMTVGDGQVIELDHPLPPRGAIERKNRPILRLGAVAGGRPLAREEQFRNDFAVGNGIAAWDGEYDQVLESLVGNRKESFLILRGVCDYSDGTSNSSKLWQPYAAVSAAALMKAIILELPAPSPPPEDD